MAIIYSKSSTEGSDPFEAMFSSRLRINMSIATESVSPK